MAATKQANKKMFDQFFLTHNDFCQLIDDQCEIIPDGLNFFI
jgi:hypothetical protein